MTFTQSVKSCLRKYGTFSGRASRAEYWWFWLFSIGGAGALAIGEQFVLGNFTKLLALMHGLSSIWALVQLLSDSALAGWFWIAILLPNLAVTSRRLHDIGRRGWWQLIVYVPLIANDTGLTRALGGGLLVMLVVLVQLIGVGALLIWLIRPGIEGENRFGLPTSST